MNITGYKSCGYCGKRFPFSDTLRVRSWAGIASIKQKFCSKKCSITFHNKSEKQRKIVRSLAGEKSVHWKGDKAGYFAMHVWIKKVMGRATFCAFCGSMKARFYEWANLSKEYERHVFDYIPACRSCHRRFDFNTERARNLERARASRKCFQKISA